MRGIAGVRARGVSFIIWWVRSSTCLESSVSDSGASVSDFGNGSFIVKGLFFFLFSFTSASVSASITEISAISARVIKVT